MKISQSCGIYRINNLQTAEFYGGGTGRDFSTRWSHHRRKLKKGNHSSPRLQSSWNIYGEAAFEFKVIELVPFSNVAQREQYWLDIWVLDPLCLNASHKAVGLGQGSHIAYAFEAPDGTQYHEIESLSAFCRIHGLIENNMYNVFRGKRFHHKGWTVIGGKSQLNPYGRSPIAHFAFSGPDGNVYNDIKHLGHFCETHGLNISVMSQVWTGKRASWHGWTKA